MAWAAIPKEKAIKTLPERRVTSQGSSLAPNTSLTTGILKMANIAAAGKIRKSIWWNESTKIFLNCSYLLALNSIAKVGRAAWARDPAKREIGTSCRTWAKLKATIDPKAAIEAKATLIRSEILIKPKARDRGHIKEIVSKTSLLLRRNLNLKRKPKERASGNWTTKWSSAPRIIPTAGA